MSTAINPGDTVLVRAEAGEEAANGERLVAIVKPHSRVVLTVPQDMLLPAVDVAFPEPAIKLGDICVLAQDSPPGWRFHVKTVLQGSHFRHKKICGLLVKGYDDEEEITGVSFWATELKVVHRK